MSKVAVVTGAARGIGKAIAIRLLEDGFKVVFSDIEEGILNKTMSEVSKLNKEAKFFKCDVSKREEVRNLCEFAKNELCSLDVMVNNAGVELTTSIDDMQDSDLDRLFKINVNGVFYGIQESVKIMRQNVNTEIKGKIINACSIAGHKGFAYLAAYSGTKFAVRGITQAAAQEYAKDKITINSFCPGIVDTPMWEKIDKVLAKYLGMKGDGDVFQHYVKNISLGRASVPDDLSKVVSFLASKDSDYMTGQSIIQDGGIVFS